MNSNIQHINTQITEHKKSVVNHPLYNQLNSIEDVQKLMEKGFDGEKLGAEINNERIKRIKIEIRFNGIS